MARIFYQPSEPAARNNLVSRVALSWSLRKDSLRTELPRPTTFIANVNLRWNAVTLVQMKL